MLIVYIFTLLLNLFYLFFKIFPIKKNKILFLSRQSDEPSIDFKLIKEELEKENKYEMVVITRRIEKNIKSVLFQMPKLLFKQMYHLSTSKVCVVDSYNILVSTLKHKRKLKIIQIWHSMAAIKKFGYDVLDTNKKRKFARIMCMHKNYDVILSPSEHMTSYFSKAFNYDEKNFMECGLPRIDYLINEDENNKNKILKKYPDYNGKETILYIPTFRENDTYKFDEFLKTIDTNKYNLIIKLHPNIKLKHENFKHINLGNDFSTLEYLSIADYVITDYSGVLLESIILNKKTYLYIYDYDEYKRHPGINIDLKKELKEYCFEKIEILYKKIENKTYNNKNLLKFKKKYINNCENNQTKKLVKRIKELLESE